MTVEFELTKDDLIAFNLYHNVHSPTMRRQYFRSWFSPAIVWLLVCTGIWYLADQERGTPLQTFLDLLPLFSGVPVFLVYFPWAYRRKLTKIVDGMISEGKNRNILSHHRLDISPEAITDSSKFEKTSNAWQAIERVVKNEDYAFIYIDSLKAFIVPRRAFADAGAFDEFIHTAMRYRENAAV